MLAFLALMGLVLAVVSRTQNPAALILALITIYWTVLQLPFFGKDRFVLPLLPFLPMFAAWGVWSVLTLSADPRLHASSDGVKPETHAE